MSKAGVEIGFVAVVSGACYSVCVNRGAQFE